MISLAKEIARALRHERSIYVVLFGVGFTHMFNGVHGLFLVEVQDANGDEFNDENGDEHVGVDGEQNRVLPQGSQTPAEAWNGGGIGRRLGFFICFTQNLINSAINSTKRSLVET